MQNFITWFGNQRSKPGRAGGANLWRQWVQQPRAIRWLLREEDTLSSEDVVTVERWADRQIEWGLHVRFHAGVANVPQIVEVLGPDLMQPHVLVYRVGAEIQIDEAHGESRRFADMVEALNFVTRCT